MKKLALTIVISCALSACVQKQKIDFPSKIVKNKTFNYSVNSGDFYVVTPSAASAGNAIAVASMLTAGNPFREYDYGYNPYSYEIEPVGNDLTTDIARKDGRKILSENNIKDPIANIVAGVIRTLEKKYDMVGKDKVSLQIDKDEYPVKSPEIASADYLLNLTSSWKINYSLIYSAKYRFEYIAYLSLSDVKGFDAPDKLDWVVYSDICTYKPKDSFSYDDITKDNAALLKQYAKNAEDYCIKKFDSKNKLD
jgi:hypothetical protein